MATQTQTQDINRAARLDLARLTRHGGQRLRVLLLYALLLAGAAFFLFPDRKSVV